MNPRTIPALPCKSITEQLHFYKALGFEVTYQQASPNVYAVVEYEGINLHFFTMKNYEPANSYSTCIITVDDAHALRKTFVDNLREKLGKLPSKGIPRITPVRGMYAGEVRFNIVDPGGNWLRFIQQVAVSPSEDLPQKESRIAHAFKGADVWANSKGDAKGAARILDVALAHNEPMSTMLKMQVGVLRAELAVTLDDADLAKKLIAEIRQIDLTDQERTQLQEELARLEELEEA